MFFFLRYYDPGYDRLSSYVSSLLRERVVLGTKSYLDRYSENHDTQGISLKLFKICILCVAVSYELFNERSSNLFKK